MPFDGNHADVHHLILKFANHDIGIVDDLLIPVSQFTVQGSEFLSKLFQPRLVDDGFSHQVHQLVEFEIRNMNRPPLSSFSAPEVWAGQVFQSFGFEAEPFPCSVLMEDLWFPVHLPEQADPRPG